MNSIPVLWLDSVNCYEISLTGGADPVFDSVGQVDKNRISIIGHPGGDIGTRIFMLSAMQTPNTPINIGKSELLGKVG